MIFAILHSAPPYFLGANDIQQPQHDFFFYSMTDCISHLGRTDCLEKAGLNISERCGIRDQAGLQRQATLCKKRLMSLRLFFFSCGGRRCYQLYKNVQMDRGGLGGLRAADTYLSVLVLATG